jgi:hypothetical protein
MADDGDTIGGFTTDDVAGAISDALSAKNVPTDGDDVTASVSSGLFHVGVRLSATVQPAGSAPPPDADADPDSVKAAPLLLEGTVQVIDDQIRVTLKLVVTETSQIVEVGSGDATGADKSAITDAAQIALGALPSLNQ